MMTQTQFDADPSMTAKALEILMPAANDDENIEQQAEMYAFETGADYA